MVPVASGGPLGLPGFVIVISVPETVPSSGVTVPVVEVDVPVSVVPSTVTLKVPSSVPVKVPQNPAADLDRTATKVPDAVPDMVPSSRPAPASYTPANVYPPPDAVTVLVLAVYVPLSCSVAGAGAITFKAPVTSVPLTYRAIEPLRLALSPLTVPTKGSTLALQRAPAQTPELPAPSSKAPATSSPVMVPVANGGPVGFAGLVMLMLVPPETVPSSAVTVPVVEVAVPLSTLPSMAKLKTPTDRKSTRLNSSHSQISYAVFCLKKKIRPRVEVVLSKLADEGVPVPDFFFFNDTATTEIYTLSLHDALPISRDW